MAIHLNRTRTFLPRITLALATTSLATFALISALQSAHTVSAQPYASPAPASVEFYTTKVLPIFQANCYRCHAGMNHRGGLQMDTQAGLLKGGRDGIVLVPGHADQSLLVKLIRHEGPADDPMPMPPKGDKISDADIATVTQWINAGAIMPPDPRP
jgi:mono/diheme cytochrome c family protein